MSSSNQLKRSISLPGLVFFGVGTMVGGGFYALMGKVAGEAGMQAPFAIALAGVFATVSGLSFAELVSRYPVSAGEARYVSEGFQKPSLSAVVGGLVILTGIVSAAALSDATVGFLRDFINVPTILATCFVVLLIGAIAGWGVGQSVGAVAVITIIEVGALILAVFLADWEVARARFEWSALLPSAPASWLGVFSAMFLAFYAFVGFEDMVNMAEEVKNPRTTVPIAILVSIGVTTAIYTIVSLVAICSVPTEQLANSNTPLAEMVQGSGWFSQTGIGIVSLLTGVNGALVQVVMASRVGYGLAQRGQAPHWLAKIHPKTQTPLRATGLATSLILLFAIFLPLTTLAKFTSAIIMLVFALVNLALWRIKRRDPDPHGVGPRLPRFVPLAGFILCALTLLFQMWLVIW